MSDWIDTYTGTVDLQHPAIRYFLCVPAPNETYTLRGNSGFVSGSELSFPAGVCKAMFEVPVPVGGQTQFNFLSESGTPVVVPPGETWTTPRGDVLS